MTTPITPEKLTALHVAIEDQLIEMRDARMFVFNANGLVVKERDGSPSDVIRMGTRWAIERILTLSDEYDAGIEAGK